ncbi:hypothetical protein PVAND_007688 [Polypedilum vanderplanki]|uniref:OBP47-like domain-containing protein n=1 Tax=Polypedilum vanderplanki TaxID=319348 RepID=A0A9J6C7Y9_POLVA|nr:hypothetical protein PVAND_007688 [Polypedilum vanderplanki]
MALWIVFLINLIVLISRNAIAADECDQLPENVDMNYEACCQFPNITDPAVEKKISDLTKDIKPDAKPTEKYLMACKIAQSVFTEMKLVKDNSVDKDAYSKMIDSKVKDDAAFWRQPLKDALDQCQKPITASGTKITDIFSQPPFNIKKEDCDAQYLVMFLCLHLDTFANCPSQAFKVNDKDPNFKQCSSIQSWFKKCGKDIDALKKVVERNNPAK